MTGTIITKQTTTIPQQKIIYRRIWEIQIQCEHPQKPEQSILKDVYNFYKKYNIAKIGDKVNV